MSKKKAGRPPLFPLDHFILRKVSENPRRKGTAAHKNFSLIKTKMKVETYRKKGGSLSELRYNVSKDFVEVVATLPNKKT